MLKMVNFMLCVFYHRENNFFFNNFFLMFIYLAVSGLSCGTRDLSLRCRLLSSCGLRALERAGLVAPRYVGS